MLYEWQHLKAKLRTRAPHLFQQFRDIPMPNPHPMFRIVSGPTPGLGEAMMAMPGPR